MRKPSIQSIGAGTLSGIMIAGLLMISNGTGALAFSGPTKPAPAPHAAAPAPHPSVQQPRPQVPAVRTPQQPMTRPTGPSYRPAGPNQPGQSTLPHQQPGVRPEGGVQPRTGTMPGGERGGLPGAERGGMPNADRRGMPGTERGNIPGGDRRGMPGGEGRPTMGNNFPHQAPHTGPAYHPGPGGVFHSSAGDFGKADPHTGRVISMTRNQPDGSHMMLHNSPTGVRRVEYTHSEFGRSVRTVTDGHRGFVERDLRRPGFHERTYYDRGRVRAVVYQDHIYRRWGAYPVFVPAYYYHPAFYGVFAAGWTGVSFGYSWASSPGYVGYGAYFAPQPVYASPNAWMADYIINANLQVNYQAQQDAGADAVADGQGGEVEQQNATPQPIPQDVRDAYAQQVQSTVAEEQSQASGQQQPTDDAPGALSPKFRVFQSYSDVEADNSGQECALVGGDFVRREEDTPDVKKTVAVTVVTIAVPSQSHCPMNTRVRVSVDTLQDWYNNFLQAQQAGMDAMAANQGQNGFPTIADTGKSDNTLGQATPDDPNAVANAIQQQSNSARTMQAAAYGGGQ